MEVALTVGYVLKEFTDHLIATVGYENTKNVYIEPFDYESAIKKFRANNKMDSDPKVSTPLFYWKRSGLRYHEHFQRRASRQRGYLTDQNGDSQLVTTVNCTVEIDWAFVTRHASEMEKFEILFLAEEGINKDKSFTTTITPLSSQVWNYYLEWDPEIEKEFFSVDTLRQEVRGKVLLHGHFPVITGDGKVIKQINSTINTFYDVPGDGVEIYTSTIS